ncbi:helix-turn-helix transcriptional regulator [Rossellomorea aquimaris]|uniref:helix-turn-helix domain-containing protein n=1 Tax=Rossellomorea aquimaris TaxID=189382 RepID=UPI001CD7E8C5|nr:helix-turn-helix transcriptional regulator [Rossellomorea aquimaris]MCA1059773.1 helix-turn-helix transcriptional regulator [Rossellomorea aquimaris]
MGKLIELRLRELLNERDIGQKTLAEMTGLTERTISELCNNKVKRYPKEAIEKIADALEINEISQIITIKESDSI